MQTSLIPVLLKWGDYKNATMTHLLKITDAVSGLQTTDGTPINLFWNRMVILAEEQVTLVLLQFLQFA